MINEMFVLAFLVVVESVRLLLGQKHEPVSMIDFDKICIVSYNFCVTFSTYLCTLKSVSEKNISSWVKKEDCFRHH